MAYQLIPVPIVNFPQIPIELQPGIQAQQFVPNTQAESPAAVFDPEAGNLGNGEVPLDSQNYNLNS